MKKLGLLITLSAIFACSLPNEAHAGTKEDRKATADKILSNESGGIAFFLNSVCFYSFRNEASGEVFSKGLKKPFNVVAVPAGWYHVEEIDCRLQYNGLRNNSGSYKVYTLTYDEDDPSIWFNKFEVKSGEVRYPGSIAGQAVINEFPVYWIFDHKDFDKQMNKKFPDLVPRLNRNPLESKIDGKLVREDVMKAYKAAYKMKPGEDKIDFKAAELEAQKVFLKHIVSAKPQEK